MQTKTVVKHISDWLYGYAKSSKSKGFIIGISGGIDSAVTSTIAAHTGLPILCVEMPINQNKIEALRAKKHISWLKKQFDNVKSIESDLTPIFKSFVELHKGELENKQLAQANARARIRMTMLYYHAQTNNSLVVGTGNKVEDFGIGFFTKYGDGGVDVSPIADLMKSEVFEIGKELNITKAILDAAPTDGLWENNRTDEEQIGATYKELEWAMTFNGDINKTSSREKKVIEIYNNFNSANKHKMLPIPICEIPKSLKQKL